MTTVHVFIQTSGDLRPFCTFDMRGDFSWEDICHVVKGMVTLNRTEDLFISVDMYPDTCHARAIVMPCGPCCTEDRAESPATQLLPEVDVVVEEDFSPDVGQLGADQEPAPRTPNTTDPKMPKMPGTPTKKPRTTFCRKLFTTEPVDEPPTKRPKLIEDVEKRSTKDEQDGMLTAALCDRCRNRTEILQRAKNCHTLFCDMKDCIKDFDLEDAYLSGFREKVLQLDQDARIADEMWWSTKLQQHEDLSLFIDYVKIVDRMAKIRHSMAKIRHSLPEWSVWRGGPGAPPPAPGGPGPSPSSE